jgi:hypothetical protein
MIRLLVLFHLVGPAIFFYCLAYLLRNPSDWTGPVTIGAVSLLLTLLTQFLGLRLIRRTPPGPLQTTLITTQVAAPFGGLLIGVMLFFLMAQH